MFSPLLDEPADVPDPRWAQGRLCKLPHMLLFAILAIATGCISYRGGERRRLPTLRQHVQEVSATTAPLGSAHSHDKGRNRDGRRTVTVFDPSGALADTDWHPYVAAIIQVERDVHTRNTKTGLLRHSAETTFHVAKVLRKPRPERGARLMGAGGEPVRAPH